MKKLLTIAGWILFSVTLLIAAAKSQTFYGTNNPNFETYTDSISNDWLLSCYAPGDTMSFRLRSEADKGFKSVIPYIDFKNQAAAKGITVKFMYCCDLNKTPGENLANITALKDAGCYVPDVELGNEYYSTIVPKLSFPAYRVKIQPFVDLFTGFNLFIPLAPRPIGINGGRKDHAVWNDSAKAYIQNKPQINIVWHLYFNAKDCPILADSLTPQLVTSSYNPYLDDYYLTLRLQLFASTLMNQVDDYLNTNFAGRTRAYTEVGIIGGDPERGTTSNIRNTFVYAEFLYYLLQNIHAYEVDIHSGISLTGVIQPTSKFDLTDGFKNKKRYEYFSLYLNKKLGAKPGICYLPLFEQPYLSGYNATVIGYEYVSSPYYYSSVGATSFFKNGSVKQYEIPLKTSPLIAGHAFGYKVVNFTPACRDTIVIVNDTTYNTIQVANPVNPKCSRFFYSLFHGKECTVTYHTEQEMIITRKEITQTICN